MLEVLLARMAPGGRCAEREPKIFSLSASDSETAWWVQRTSYVTRELGLRERGTHLDGEIDVAELLNALDRNEPAPSRIRVFLAKLALLHVLREQLVHESEALGELRLAVVGQQDLDFGGLRRSRQRGAAARAPRRAYLGSDVGNTQTHLSRADHSHLLHSVSTGREIRCCAERAGCGVSRA